MVAEGAFAAQFAGVHVAFEDDLAVGGHLQIVRHAGHHLDALAPQEAGEHHLAEEGWQGRGGGVGQRRVAAEAHGHGHALVPAVAVAVPGAIVVELGVEAQGAVVEDLQSVEAQVAVAGLLVAGVAEAEGDEGAAVLGPGGEHGQIGEPHLVALQHHLLAHPLPDGLRHPVPDLGQDGQLGQLLEEAGAGLGHGLLDQLLDAVGDGIQAPGFAIHAEGHLHALQAAEGVHDHGHGVPPGLVEAQGLPAPGLLGDAVGDGRHLQHGIHLDGDAGQLARGLELLQEGLEVAANGFSGFHLPKGPLFAGKFPVSASQRENRPIGVVLSAGTVLSGCYRLTILFHYVSIASWPPNPSSATTRKPCSRGNGSFGSHPSRQWPCGSWPC
ncbi:hypothetical protein GALL_531150 [mine drainage metagenome]|uniref:Uncharacterized protein n=1 Tax=mine drainage metagenome TaxID=410659 RepID=A0A1J5P3S9_9ZZZZ